MGYHIRRRFIRDHVFLANGFEHQIGHTYLHGRFEYWRRIATRYNRHATPACPLSPSESQSTTGCDQ